MNIAAIRAFYLEGAIVKAGAVVECDDRLARQLIGCGKAVLAESTRKPARRGPMTTKTAGAIVPGLVEAKDTP